MRFRSSVFAFSLPLFAFACGSEPFVPEGAKRGQTATLACTDNTQCAAGKETCNVAKKVCEKIPAGIELGTGDGSALSVTFTEIYTSAGTELVDLAFNADDPTQIWALAYDSDSVILGTNTVPGPGTWRGIHDPAAVHFMHKPTAIAWGANGLWATCGDNDNAQNDPRGANEPNFFMGPALFTSDLSIFAKQNPAVGLNLGSHVDMLHNTSFCRGIAHVSENWFWVFNGQLGSLDKYNFATPHIPGADDHSDGEIYRYALGQVKGVDGIPSHLAYDADDKFLYVADTGNARIVKLDTTSGTLGGLLPLRNEVLAKNGVMTETNVVPLAIASGVLQQPSGIEVHNGLVYVSDTKTGTFHCFDKDGNEVRRLQTGLPEKSLAGFGFSSDNKLWFTDRVRGKVIRVDVPAK
jgi:hypothetical protein